MRLRSTFALLAAAWLIAASAPCGADRLPTYWGKFGGQAIIEVPGEPQPWTGKPGQVIEGSGYKLIRIAPDGTSVTLERTEGERRRIDLKLQKEPESASPSPKTSDEDIEAMRFPESRVPVEAAPEPEDEAPEAAPSVLEVPPARGTWERFIKKRPGHRLQVGLEPAVEPTLEPSPLEPSQVDVLSLLVDGACLPWRGNKGFAALEPYRVQQFPVVAGTAHTVPPASIGPCVIHWVKGAAVVVAFGLEVTSCGPDSFRVVIPRDGFDGTVRNLAGYGSGDDVDVLLLRAERR